MYNFLSNFTYISFKFINFEYQSYLQTGSSEPDLNHRIHSPDGTPFPVLIWFLRATVKLLWKVVRKPPNPTFNQTEHQILLHALPLPVSLHRNNFQSPWIPTSMCQTNRLSTIFPQSSASLQFIIGFWLHESIVDKKLNVFWLCLV